MKWTSKEKSALRKQVKAGVSLEEIRVGDRTTFSIRYQLYRMGLVIKSERWSRTEVRLLKNLYMVGIEPHLIEIPGRTKTAIRNKLIRLGVLKTKKRKQKAWNMKDIKLLKQLVLERGYTSNQLYTNNWFPTRSKNSIAQQMRRLRIKRGW